MTKMGSYFSSVGIGVRAGDPIWGSNPSNRGTVDVLTDSLSSYSQSVSVDIGYDSLDISIIVREEEVYDWLEIGLGRDIQSVNSGQEDIWSGFVNEINASADGVNIRRGPMVSAPNRVSIDYVNLNNSVVPPISGVKKSTAAADELDAQALYGILEKQINGGSLTATEAAQNRDVYLRNSAWPETSQEVYNESGSDAYVVISIRCLGYGHLLDCFCYLDANAGTRACSSIITDVISAQPSAVFSTDVSRVTANATLMTRYSDGKTTARSAIKRVVDFGDNAFNRWVFGVYERREAVYRPVPTDIEYKRLRNDPTKNVYKYNTGDLVYPWDVLPGYNLVMSDSIFSGDFTIDFAEDPKIVFIESVQFTAPWTLHLSKGRTSKIKQRLARYGIGGM